MQDPSLPFSVKFKKIIQLPPSSDFITCIDANYDLSYVVAAKSENQTVELRVDTVEDGEIIFTFNVLGRIGIKGNTLFYNPTHLINAETICTLVEDKKHIWETKIKSGNFHMKICTICGRCESTPL